MAHTIALGEVGQFKDKLGSNIDPLPAVTVDGPSGAARLIAVKQKFNELQEKRRNFHLRQGGVAAAAGAKGGKAGVFAAGISALHQQKRLKEILAEMEKCITQVNMLRAAFGTTPGWAAAEAQCTLDEKAFEKKSLDRKSLHGGL